MNRASGAGTEGQSSGTTTFPDFVLFYLLGRSGINPAGDVLMQSWADDPSPEVGDWLFQR